MGIKPARVSGADCVFHNPRNYAKHPKHALAADTTGAHRPPNSRHPPRASQREPSTAPKDRAQGVYHQHGKWIASTRQYSPSLTVTQFEDEGDIWHTRLPKSGLGNLGDVRIHVPGMSILHPYIHCAEDHSICQLTTGMGEINGAATMMALAFSDKFDLRSTYFIVSGIAGVNPKHGTLGSVAIVKYAVQVALQYEIDARSIPEDWETGYLAFGTKKPFEYPSIIYGTEVFELNEALRDVAARLAGMATLSDSRETNTYRLNYAGMGRDFAPGAQPPAVIKCDVATSDVYYSGTLLSSAFEKTSVVWTNGSAKYCMSAQEDNATLEVLVRAAVAGLVDFGRVIVMRAG